VAQRYQTKARTQYGFGLFGLFTYATRLSVVLLMGSYDKVVAIHEKMKGKTLVIVLSVCLVAGSIWVGISIDYWRVLHFIIWRPQVTIRKVHFPGADKDLYLKAYHDGLNRTIKVISGSGSRFAGPDSEEDFMLSTQQDFFYETNGDTLKVYLPEIFTTPGNPPEGIVVQQYLLENPEYMNLYDKRRKGDLHLDIF